jgi:hypothetical protein
MYVPVITPNLKSGGSHFRGFSGISLPLTRLAARAVLLLCSTEPLLALCARDDERNCNLAVLTGSAQQNVAPTKSGNLNHHAGLSFISCAHKELWKSFVCNVQCEVCRTGREPYLCLHQLCQLCLHRHEFSERYHHGLSV